MIKGGVAAKLGDGYEAEWTLLEALRVLRGEAMSLRIEPFDEQADGFEFRLTTADCVSWHQCKRRRAGGSWTLTALASEGVLDAFAGKLANEGAECVFISQDRAEPLIGITEKAGQVESVAAFQAALNVEEGDGFRRLQEIWGLEPAIAFSWLRRCRVETAGHQTLRKMVADVCGLLFQADPDICRGKLRTFLEDRLTQTITTEAFRSAVDDLGLGWLARLDPTLDRVFVDATDRYLATLGDPILEHPIVTPDMTKAVEAVFEPVNRWTVVAGGAGSGKSLVLSQIVAAARDRGWPVLAFRIDHFLATGSAEEIGDQLMARRQSPISLFGNRHGLQDCLLVIDQLDAVSEASGRTGRIREELFRMIESSSLYPGLRLVLACRTYDLERDSRLRPLAEGPRRTGVTLPPLDWATLVEPVLQQLGMEGRVFSARERDVLGIPINLSLLARLKALGEPVEGELSGVRLFTALVEKRASDFLALNIPWTPWAALHAIARRMSDSQELTAPAGVLAPYPGAADLLASSGFIKAANGRIQFAHESFFDHAFADAFVAAGGDLLDLLRSDLQRLFRRTQVRQILSRLRDLQSRAYLPSLISVMNEPDIRYLIRDAVAAWLSVVDDPSEAELRLVDSWRAEGHRNALFAKTIHASPNWAPALIACGHVARWLEDDAERDKALWILRRASETRPELSEPVLRTWWAGRDDRILQLVDWFGRLHPSNPIGPLQGLYRDLIRAFPEDRISRKGFDGLVDLGPWSDTGSGLGVAVLGYWIERWMAAFTDSHPFADKLDDDRRYWVSELATHQPDAFLSALMPLLAEGLRRDLASGGTSGAADFRFRVIDGEPDGATLLQFLADSLVTLAETAPTRVAVLLNLLPNESRIVVWLELRAIAAGGSALAGRLGALHDHAELLEATFGEGPSALSQALTASAAHLDPDAKDRLERRILAHEPEIARAIEARRSGNAWAVRSLYNTGLAQRFLLASARGAWGPAGQRRLAELDRKFGDRPLWTRSSGGGIVQSPIPGNRAAAMTDTQWIGAMRRYNGKRDGGWTGGEMVGGVNQVASDLRYYTTLDPGRFVCLLESLPADVVSEYPMAILSGLSREAKPTPDHVARAVRAAERWAHPELGKMAAWAVQHAGGATRDREVLDRMLRSAASGQASNSVVKSSKPGATARDRVEQRLQADSQDAMNSMNEERGSAWSALATALWEDETLLDPVASLLEARMDVEPLTSVRMPMLHAINSVCKHDIARGLALLNRMLAIRPEALVSQAGLQILSWAKNHPAFDMDGLIALDQARNPPLKTLSLLMQAQLAALHEDRNTAFVARFRGERAVREIAAFLGTRYLSAEAENGRVSSWMMELFNDRDPRVLEECQGIDWAALLDRADSRTELVSTFVASPCFEARSDRLMLALTDRVARYPDLALHGARRAIALAPTWSGEAGKGHFSTVHRMGRLLMALYQLDQGNPARESDLLDLFDDFLARDVYDIRKEVDAVERH